MRITYLSPCPTCGSDLFSNPPEIPDVICNNGHRFANIGEVLQRLATKPEAERPLWMPFVDEQRAEVEQRLSRLRWRPGPGGDVFAVVRVPEIHARAIEAEAQRLLKTPDQYFQEMVVHGLEHRWFY
jgi:DNA-binding transcriptional MerR regulator